MIWKQREAQKKQRAFYNKLVSEHVDSVHRAAYRLSGKAAEAEDLTQDVFLKAWRSIERLPEMEAPRPWLFKVLRNAWLDRLRKSGRRLQLVATDEEPEAESPEPVARLSGLEDQELLNEHLDNEVMEAMDELPEGERLVLLFHAFGELSYGEIAEATDSPIGTVMSRLHRARTKLRKRLEAYAIRRRLIEGKENPG